MIQENEIPKYLKLTGSNISKSNRKSKHKHQYEECLIQYHLPRSTRMHTSLYSYCTICRKIGDRFKEDKCIVKDYIRIIDSPIGKCYSRIPDKELYEKYHDKLPVFFVEDICKEKYVDLEQSDNSDEE